ncbi:MFS transporter [Janthinobacterium fluminis]|uniref:MFS transporter n=1 Tax=Janthinobacterium fluminis TaxID=2987524 RepID=A0ABT5JXE5_9BURK|nr:MFS transporter [Janthinobacterium fluminis]MDC8757419.1 MFS transporter [Janthinobacterium fluminis]
MNTNKTNSRSPATWIPTLYFAQGLPFYAVALVAGLMFKSMGVPNEDIAYWTGMIGFAWVFKSLWSPFLELAPSKKIIIVTFQFVGGLSLGLVALALQTPVWFAAGIAVLGLAAVASATHDIACDGLYISSLTDQQQAAYAGWTGAFFNAGKFISLGGLVILAGHFEKTIGVAPAWTIIFLILGAMMLLLALYHTWALPLAANPATDKQSVGAIAATLWDVLSEFFKKPGIGMAIVFIILFRAGEAQVQTIGPLFLREARALGGLGLSTTEVGAIYGTAGTVAFVLGSIGGGYFASWLGLKRAMPFLILAMNLPNLVFYYLSHALPTDIAVITATLGVEMFGYGFGFIGLILFMMQVVATGKYQTAHYAFATGIMQLGLVLFKMVSGAIQTALGYPKFFLWVLLAALPVLILSRFMPLRAKDAPGADAQAVAA